MKEGVGFAVDRQSKRQLNDRVGQNQSVMMAMGQEKRRFSGTIQKAISYRPNSQPLL